MSFRIATSSLDPFFCMKSSCKKEEEDGGTKYKTDFVSR